MLFNIYVERIYQLALENIRKGIKINGIPINNLRYADDTAILAENIENLQLLVSTVNQATTEYGYTINIGKTKLITVSRQGHENAQVFVDN